jgi:signal transduction histidine kinase
MLDTEFKKYVINIQNDKNKSIIDEIINDYKDKDNNWSNVNIEHIGLSALESGLIIKVTDKENNVLWDAMEHNSGICAQMLAEMAHNMKEYYPNFDGKYTDKKFNLEVDNKIIGEVLIGYYGPYYFNENDIVFLKTFNNILVAVAIISIISSIALGIFMSRRITRNLTNVINTTKEIAHGNYKNRIQEKSSTKEIIDLIETVDDLALRLDKQEKLRKDLTSDVAHELRTPITTLQTHLEAVKDGIFKLDETRINSLYEETIRISKIVNDLDNLTKYDNNNIVLNKNNFNVKKAILAIVKNFEREAKNKNIMIKVIGNDLNILADRDKITQVFINLISNSLKYTKDNGYIDVEIERSDEFIKISVKDNGIGISENDLPYIFERFYRADKSRTRATGGSGIGLSIVKNIVDIHHGYITVDSKINKGTCISIFLPL